MDNILYLDDFINYYSNKLNKIVSIKPYKNTLDKGRIINRKKFITCFLKLKEKYDLNNNLFTEKLIIIVNSNLKVEDKLLIKDIMEELNYKNVLFINELEIIKIDIKSLFINFNFSYFNLYFIKEDGKAKLNIYENDFINRNMLLDIIKLLNKNKIIISGKNYKEIINMLKDTNYEYYYFEDNNNIFIDLYLKNKTV